MVALTRLLVGMRETLADWLALRWRDLLFAESHAAQLAFVALLGATVLLFLARRLSHGGVKRSHLGLPAILPVMRRSRFSAVRHGALFVFLAGVPFFAVALADPHTSLQRDTVTYPG